MNIEDLYQELILDHGTQPRNCCALPSANHTAEGFNPLCGDKICVYLKIENQIIKAASFTGSGCAISTASASLMTEALIGKSLEEISALSADFKALLNTEGASKASLEKLRALEGVKIFPARVKCATLAWHTLEAAIRQSTEIINTPITTE